MTPITRSDEAMPEPEPGTLPASARAPSRSTAPATPETIDAPKCAPPTLVTAGHDVLFGPDEPRCDACGEVLTPGSDEEEEAHGATGGHGLYVWVHNGRVTYEEPPLCPTCAAAITITALQRWEMEEEEG